MLTHWSYAFLALTHRHEDAVSTLTSYSGWSDRACPACLGYIFESSVVPASCARWRGCQTVCGGLAFCPGSSAWTRTHVTEMWRHKSHVTDDKMRRHREMKWNGVMGFRLFLHHEAIGDSLRRWKNEWNMLSTQVQGSITGPSRRQPTYCHAIGSGQTPDRQTSEHIIQP